MSPDPHCPLCRSDRRTPLVELAYEQIWRRLEADWGAGFSSQVRQRHTPAAKVALCRCVRCGLDYFVPAVPGDSEFYSELMQAVDYDENRWEFAVVAGLMTGCGSVVDFGSGDGAFLKRLRGRCDRLVGVDYNEAALADLGNSGLEAYAGDFGTFASIERDAFDVASAFQLIEHISDVSTLVAPMITATKPGGSIFISLPNRDRFGAEIDSPLDCPPHHASRWSAAQLEELARRFSLQLVRIRYSPPAYPEAVAIAMGPVDRLLGRPPARRPTWLLRGLIRRGMIGPRRYDLAVRAGLFARRGIHGHTMLAELRVPQ